jgi:hypothetical protein
VIDLEAVAVAIDAFRMAVANGQKAHHRYFEEKRSDENLQSLYASIRKIDATEKAMLTAIGIDPEAVQAARTALAERAAEEAGYL